MSRIYKRDRQTEAFCYQSRQRPSPIFGAREIPVYCFQHAGNQKGYNRWQETAFLKYTGDTNLGAS